MDRSREFRLISTGGQNTELVSTADLSPDGGALLVAGIWSGLNWVDLSSGRVLKLSSDKLRAARFLRDGQTFFANVDHEKMLLWPLRVSTNHAGELNASLGLARTLPGADWNISDSASLSDDERLVGGKIDRGEVRIVRRDETNRVTRLRGALNACRPTFSADHRWVVTASEGGGGPCHWDADTGKLVRVLHAHPGNGGAQFSPDGRVLVTSDTTGVRFYDTATWTVTRHLPADLGTGLAGCAAFTPDSRLVAFTTGKRVLRLADPRTGEVLATLTSPEPRPINSLRFSRDGRLLAVATSTDAVDLWDIGLLDEGLKKLGLGLPR